MGETTGISWAHHTFNPWRGCTKVSEGCRNCYAERWSKRNQRTLGVWGPKGSRPVAAESMWRLPRAWNLEAEAAGERRRVFCASLADVFEGTDTMPPDSHYEVNNARVRLFELIESTPWLDWMLLTKRPQNIIKMVPTRWLTRFPENVWLGTSAENQAMADLRLPQLLQYRARVLFVSIGPQIGPIYLGYEGANALWIQKSRSGMYEYDPFGEGSRQLDWVIVEGESGPGARPFDPQWAHDLMVQCRAAGCAFHLKQMGSQPYDRSNDCPVRILDAAGHEWEGYNHLRVREFPGVRR